MRDVAVAVLLTAVALGSPLWALLPFVPDGRAALQTAALILALPVVVVAGLTQSDAARRRCGDGGRWVTAATGSALLVLLALALAVANQMRLEGPFCTVAIDPGARSEVVVTHTCGLGTHATVEVNRHRVVLGMVLGSRLD